jgi:SAM-dependent methyltransferase
MNDDCKNAGLAPPSGDWPAEGLEDLGRCPVCGAADRALLYDNLRDKIFFAAPGIWKMWRCGGCGVGYLDPRPTVGTIGRAYANYYTHEDWQPGSDPFEPGSSSLVKRVWRGLRNDYINARYGYRFRPGIPGGRFVMQAFPAKRLWMDNYIRHLPAPKPGHNRLLDAGCGSGYFLPIAQTLGYQAEGLEIDPKACARAHAHGLTVHQGSFPDTGLESKSFDEITLSHVLEHLHDPVGALREASRVLRPEGRIWIVVPNLEGASNREWKENSRLLEPPRHVIMFDVNSLKRLLAESGFTGVRQIPVVNSISRFIYSASHAIASGSNPEKAQWRDIPESLKRQAVREEKIYSGISPFSDAITFEGFKQ